ncbi:MAG: response regulator [Odoribacter sp.]
MKTAVQFPDWSTKTILIAEDYDDNYALLAALLKHTHIHILWAHNGREAIDMALKQPEINVILMDITMPEFDGIEALRCIKQEIPNKIVIAQTAHGMSVSINTENFNDILLKPIRCSLLIETLRKYL